MRINFQCSLDNLHEYKFILCDIRPIFKVVNLTQMRTINFQTELRTGSKPDEFLIPTQH